MELVGLPDSETREFHYLIAWAIDSYGVISNYDTLKSKLSQKNRSSIPELLKRQCMPGTVYV